MEERSILDAMAEFAEGVARYVFAPDYYEGRWYVICGDKRRMCRNYQTAKAWADYLYRQGYHWHYSIALQKEK